MEKRVKRYTARTVFYFLGILVCLWYYSHSLSDYVADWSKPISIEQVQTADGATSKKPTWNIKWEKDFIPHSQHPKFFFEKLLGIKFPWFPNVVLMFLIYPWLLMAWFLFYDRSGLWFHGTNYSNILQVFYVNAVFWTGWGIWGAILKHKTNILMVVSDAELLKAINHSQHSNLNSLIFLKPLWLFFLFGLIINFMILVFGGVYAHKIIRGFKHIPVLIKNLSRWLSKPWLGVRFKIKRSGRVVAKKIQLKYLFFIPYLKITRLTVPLPDFLFCLRQGLLGDAANRFLKKHREVVLEQLGRSFRELTHESRGFFEGTPLPKNLRFIVKKGNKTLVVIQEEPSVRSVSFSPLVIREQTKKLHTEHETNDFKKEIAEKKTTDLFKLAFPYCIFVIVIHKNTSGKLLAFWSPSQIDSLNDEVYQFGLPNIATSGDVCLGNDSVTNNSLAQFCDRMVELFWRGHFSNHMLGVLNRYQKANGSLRTLFHWERHSTQDPSFIRHVSMDRPFEKKNELETVVFRTLNNLLAYLARDERWESDTRFERMVDDFLANQPVDLARLEKIPGSLTPEQLFDLLAEGIKE